jgi:hypothetical protein
LDCALCVRRWDVANGSLERNFDLGRSLLWPACIPAPKQAGEGAALLPSAAPSLEPPVQIVERDLRAVLCAEAREPIGGA